MNWYLDNKIIRAITYKLSSLFALLYILIYLGKIPANESFFYLLLAFIVSIGIGGLGFLINDYFDIEEDRLAGKHNLFLKLSKPQLAALSVLILAFAILPWKIFPFSAVSLLLLISEIMLFLVYSVKPFRFKERGFLGVIIDAMYAHVVPTCFAVYTFSLIITKTFMASPIAGNFFLIVIWVLLTGIRNILMHQISDMDNDAVSGTRTFLQQYGKQRIYRWLCYGLFPAELVFFLAFILSMPNTRIVAPVYVLFILLYYLKRKKTFLKEGKLKMDVFCDFISSQLMNEFYEKWLAIVLLATFATDHIYFGILMIMHLILFFPIYYDTIR